MTFTDQQSQSIKYLKLIRRKSFSFLGVVRKSCLVHTVHNDFIAIGALNTETVYHDGPFGRVAEAGGGHQLRFDTIRYDNFIYTRYFHQLIKLIIYSNVSIYLTTIKFINSNSNKK